MPGTLAASPFLLHGGDPLGEVVETAAGEGPSEGVEQGLPDGPGELSFGHDASPVSGPVGFGTTWQVPTRRRCFSIRHARSVIVEFFETVASFLEFFRPRTGLMQGLRGLCAIGRLLIPLHVQGDTLANVFSRPH